MMKREESGESTDSGTTEKSPVLENSPPIVFSTANAWMTERIYEKINVLEQAKKDGKDKKDKNKNGQEQAVIKLLDKILDYPEFLHMENYALDNLFITDADIDNLFQEYDNNYIKKIVGNLTGTDNISKRRTLSLMILSSRLSPTYMLRTNPEKRLYDSLLAAFDEGRSDQFTSANIAAIVQPFVRANMANKQYLINLFNGNTMYDIYKNNYLAPESEISKVLIIKRLQTWLGRKVIDLPVSYLFNRYTNKEKDRLNKKTDVCSIISNYKSSIPMNVPTSLMPPSVFSVNQDDELDVDKINKLLYQMAPKAVKKKMSKMSKKNITSKQKKGGPSPAIAAASSGPSSTSTSNSISTAPVKPIIKSADSKEKGKGKSKGTRRRVGFSTGTKLA
jgi:hypothetical protein